MTRLRRLRGSCSGLCLLSAPPGRPLVKRLSLRRTGCGERLPGRRGAGRRRRGRAGSGGAGLHARQYSDDAAAAAPQRQFPPHASVRRQPPAGNVRRAGERTVRAGPGRHHRVRIPLRDRAARRGGGVSFQLRQDHSAVWQVRRHPPGCGARRSRCRAWSRSKVPTTSRNGSRRRSGRRVSRRFSSVWRCTSSPIWVHNSAAAIASIARRSTSASAAGSGSGRLTYLVGEVSPRAAGYAPGDAEYGFGIEKRVRRARVSVDVREHVRHDVGSAGARRLTRKPVPGIQPDAQVFLKRPQLRLGGQCPPQADKEQEPCPVSLFLRSFSPSSPPAAAATHRTPPPAPPNQVRVHGHIVCAERSAGVGSQQCGNRRQGHGDDHDERDAGTRPAPSRRAPLTWSRPSPGSRTERSSPRPTFTPATPPRLAVWWLRWFPRRAR